MRGSTRVPAESRTTSRDQLRTKHIIRPIIVYGKGTIGFQKDNVKKNRICSQHFDGSRHEAFRTDGKRVFRLFRIRCTKPKSKERHLFFDVLADANLSSCTSRQRAPSKVGIRSTGILFFVGQSASCRSKLNWRVFKPSWQIS